MRKKQLPEIEKGLSRLAQNNSAITKIIIFGSFARGSEGKRSDIDIIVVMKTDKPFLKRYDDVQSDIWECVKPYPLELLIYTPEEFKNMVALNNAFIRKALSEGKVVYE